MNESTKTAQITTGLDLYVITCPSASCGHQFAMQSYLPGQFEDDHQWFHAARVDFCPYCGHDCRDAKPKTESAMNSPEVNTLAETLLAAYNAAWEPQTTREQDWQAVAQAAQAWFDAQRAETLKQQEGKSLAQVAWEANEYGEDIKMDAESVEKYIRIAAAVESAVLARIDSGRKVTAEEFAERAWNATHIVSTTGYRHEMIKALAALYREFCPVAAESSRAQITLNRIWDILGFPTGESEGRDIIPIIEGLKNSTVPEPKSAYFLTATRPPTAEDANENGLIEWARHGFERWLPAAWEITAGKPSDRPLWRPVDRPPSAPPVSEDEKAFDVWRPVDRPPAAPPVLEDEKALRAFIADATAGMTDPSNRAESKVCLQVGWYAALAHARREQAKGGKAE